MLYTKIPILFILLDLFCINKDFTIRQFPGSQLYNDTVVEVVSFKQLQKHAETKMNDTLYILNFWATWCKPCVEEMPFFEKASQSFLSEKVKFYYISLNSVKELAEVAHFAKTKNIQNPVLLLNETNPNDWIDRIDSSWSGSIPATVMYRSGKKIFFKEGSFTRAEIISTISINIKKN